VYYPSTGLLSAKKKKIKQRWQYKSGPLAASTINIAHSVLVEEIHRFEASKMEIL
jgi:hypothetical protein